MIVLSPCAICGAPARHVYPVLQNAPTQAIYYGPDDPLPGPTVYGAIRYCEAHRPVAVGVPNGTAVDQQAVRRRR